MILLDTHALIWWREGDPRLSRHAQSVIANEEQIGIIAISAFSFWEIAMLEKRKRLQLSSGLSQWIAVTEALACTLFVPVDTNIAVASVHLPSGLHQDPADRIIVATAIVLNTPLVTVDKQLRAYPHVQTIW
ncbi:MAG: type II toxin-antitoxin system VapC family toxin [Duganella sp.]